jgi:hypothetical protein
VREPDGGRPEDVLEVAGQVGLIVEARLGRRLARGHAVEQETARQVDAAAGHVLVRADAELRAERPHQVGGMGVQPRRRLPEQYRLRDRRVQKVTEAVGDPLGSCHGAFGWMMLKIVAETVDDQREAALGLQLVPGPAQRLVQLPDAETQDRIGEHRPVGGPPDQPLRQLPEVQVDDALAESRLRRRPPVVRDVRRQERDHLVQGAVLVAVHVVADHAIVDDQQRPRVVGVHRVDVIRHVGVENLGDTGHPGPPRPEPQDASPASAAVSHAKIVQDGPVA